MSRRVRLEGTPKAPVGPFSEKRLHDGVYPRQVRQTVVLERGLVTGSTRPPGRGADSVESSTTSQ